MLSYAMLALLTTCFSSLQIDQGYKVLKNWDFNANEDWSYGNEIINPEISKSILEFTSSGNDPILYGPVYDPIPANNRQRIEIRLKADSPGTWELFYTNTNEGRFGGYDQKWSLRFHVPASKDWQTVSVSPFWGALGKTVKLRLDPACGHFQIDWVRIAETTDSELSWKSHKWFIEQNSGSLVIDKDLLKAKANEGGCTFFTYPDIDSTKSNVLYIKGMGKDQESISFCWANDVTPGLHIAGLQFNPDGQMYSTNINLSRFEEWQGRIDVVGFIFGETPKDILTLEEFSLSDSPQGEPDLELSLIVAEPVIRRQGQTATISAYIRNTGGKTYPGGSVTLIFSEVSSTQQIPALDFNEKTILKWTFLPQESGNIPIKINIDGKWNLSGSIRVESAIDVVKSDYVPEPRPVNTNPYQIGIYYFPGWSPDQWNRWEKQKGFPERDPVLGFYREGDPEVADWHIKWAVENGISYFMYDWYWRDGHIMLEKGLEEGYLKAKYRDYIKFCVMWANHAPFANHTIEQLLNVTDYWVKNYFMLDCYYKIDGKPVVSFFATDNLTNDLGGSENVRKAFDAMRKRVQEAGLPGIYFIACGDNSPNSQKRFKEESYDCISAYNYPSAGARSQWSSYKSLMKGHVDIWNNSLRDKILEYMPLLTVGWDSRPWHDNNALVRFGRSSENFKEGLLAMKNWLATNNRHIGLLEAWNEWGEGSYIEPNSEFGFGDLEAIRSVFAKPGEYPQNVAPSDVGLGPYNISTIDHGLSD